MAMKAKNVVKLSSKNAEKAEKKTAPAPEPAPEKRGPGRPKGTVPDDETPSQRFVRLAPARTAKALKALSSVEKLGGRAYEYSEEDANGIIDALTDAVAAVKRTLLATENKAPGKAGFILPSQRG